MYILILLMLQNSDTHWQQQFKYLIVAIRIYLIRVAKKFLLRKIHHSNNHTDLPVESALLSEFSETEILIASGVTAMQPSGGRLTVYILLGDRIVLSLPTKQKKQSVWLLISV